MNRKSLSNRSLLAILIVIGCYNVSYSQTALIEVSDFGYHQQTPHSIIELDSGEIFISGQVLPKGDSINRSVFFAEYNLDFELIKHALLRTENESLTNSSTELLHRNGILLKASFDIFVDNSYISKYNISSDELIRCHSFVDTINNFDAASIGSILLNSESQLVATVVNNARDIWIRIMDPDVRFTPFEILEIEDGYLVVGSQLVDDAFSLFFM